MRERRDIATRLRPEDPPGGDVLVIRGGPDTTGTLGQDAARTAEFWALEGVPLLGISVFAVLGMPLDQLLRDRSAGLALSIACKLPTLKSSSYSRRSGVLTSRSAFSKPTPRSYPAC